MKIKPEFTEGQPVTFNWVEMISRKPCKVATVVAKVLAPTKNIKEYRYRIVKVSNALVNGGSAIMYGADLTASV